MPASSAGLNKANPRMSKQSSEARPDVAGLVLKIHGTWQSAKGSRQTDLHQGDAIINGSSLKASSADASVTIVLTDGTKLKCPSCEACQKPISVAKTDSSSNRWLTAAIGMFVQKPSTWVVTQSRQASLTFQQPNVKDAAVIADKNGRIDLTPAILSGHGTYDVRITAPTMTNSKLVANTRLELAENTRPTMQVPGLASGLYRIELIQNPDEPGIEAWILLCDEKTFDNKQAAFLKAAEEARGWIQEKEPTSSPEETLTPDTVRSLLRAYLACLVD
jgi:hypothetical protein